MAITVNNLRKETFELKAHKQVHPRTSFGARFSRTLFPRFVFGFLSVVAIVAAGLGAIVRACLLFYI